jgi:hypothetical protein
MKKILLFLAFMASFSANSQSPMDTAIANFLHNTSGCCTSSGGSVIDTDSQSLSIVGNVLTISRGNSITLPSSGGSGIINVDSVWYSLSGDSLYVKDGGTTIGYLMKRYVDTIYTNSTKDTIFYTKNGTTVKFPIGGASATPEKAIFSATNNAAIVGHQSTTPITTGWTQSVNIGGGSFSAGAYTIPLDGVYSVTFYARFATADWPARAEATATIRLNGTAIAAASNIYPAAITADAHNTGTAVIVRNFVAGDVITTSIWQEAGANRTLSSNIYNHFIVERIF